MHIYCASPRRDHLEHQRGYNRNSRSCTVKRAWRNGRKNEHWAVFAWVSQDLHAQRPHRGRNPPAHLAESQNEAGFSCQEQHGHGLRAAPRGCWDATWSPVLAPTRVCVLASVCVYALRLDMYVCVCRPARLSPSLFLSPLARLPLC